MSTSQPPQKPSDMIVMTRLNTVGLKRLAEGSLVEKAHLDSRPPMPSRPPIIVNEPPKVAPVAPTTFEADNTQENDAMLGADAAEDRTIARPAKVDEDDTRGMDAFVIPAAAKPPKPATQPPPKKVASPMAFAATMDVNKAKSDAQGVVVDPRLEIETPTALFVKDIQATLKEELAKQQKAAHDKNAETKAPPRFELPPLDIAPISEASTSASRGRSRTEPALEEMPNFDQPTKIEPKAALMKNVPAPPLSKPASLAPPAKSSSSSLPAPLPAQANRRKDPAGVSVSARPARIERKGGFAPWAAALTALGVFVGVAGARVATGAPFTRGQQAPLTAPAAAGVNNEPGFAPRVVVPEQKPVEVAPAPVEAKQEAKAEEPKVADTKPVEPLKEEAKAEKVEAKNEKPEPVAVEAKPEKHAAPAERPRVRRAAPPPVAEKPEPKPVVAEKPEPKPEPVAAKPKPEKVEKAEKPEPPAKPASKSPDVAAAARDYAAVESQLGQSL